MNDPDETRAGAAHDLQRALDACVAFLRAVPADRHTLADQVLGRAAGFALAAATDAVEGAVGRLGGLTLLAGGLDYDRLAAWRARLGGATAGPRYALLAGPDGPALAAVVRRPVLDPEAPAAGPATGPAAAAAYTARAASVLGALAHALPAAELVAVLAAIRHPDPTSRVAALAGVVSLLASELTGLPPADYRLDVLLGGWPTWLLAQPLPPRRPRS